ncbi:MAG TPA: CGNR zinc finger domain-containing protein [Thermoanaerobaculia bacterium]|nr:CGNR zinc finger domain-containing protein [Thermoanaerobaculia bacterium]
MSSFVSVGGTPALDFVNTEILSADDFAAWLRGAGFDVNARGALREVKAFRATLRAMFLRIAGGGKARRSELEAINEVLARGRGALRLESEKGSLRLRFKGGERDPLFLLARATAELLAGAELARIRQCEGSGCILLFYDTTKSHTRRWCSMAVCGNRMKAALFYERSRSAR